MTPTPRKGSFMNVEIAQRLAEMRREKGFSQEELAARLGLSRQAVSKWERAESSPDTGNLIALADLYGVTLDELVRVEADIADDVTFESSDRAASAEVEAPRRPSSRLLHLLRGSRRHRRRPASPALPSTRRVPARQPHPSRTPRRRQRGRPAPPRIPAPARPCRLRRTATRRCSNPATAPPSRRSSRRAPTTRRTDAVATARG